MARVLEAPCSSLDGGQKLLRHLRHVGVRADAGPVSVTNYKGTFMVS